MSTERAEEQELIQQQPALVNLEYSLTTLATGFYQNCQIGLHEIRV